MLTKIIDAAQDALSGDRMEEEPEARAMRDDGRSDVSPFDQALRERSQSTLQMVEEALDARRGVLAYQPVMIAEGKGRTAFHEGLIRVQDPGGRIIPAGDFMNSVEDREAGRRIDALALELGLRELRAQPDLRLSINMSARSIGYRPWMEALEAGLSADPTAAERLILEITERSAMTMPELVISFMADLSDRGIAFALDDFGAGMTSFRYLRDFYFDVMKIDRSFVSGLQHSPDDRALIGAMISVARHFEMLVVAENVEEADEMRVLVDLGVDCLQGYYFAAPMLTPPWRADAREAG